MVSMNIPIISIGPMCHSKTIIKIYGYNSETHFFDWIESDYHDFIYILKLIKTRRGLKYNIFGQKYNIFGKKKITIENKYHKRGIIKNTNIEANNHGRTLIFKNMKFHHEIMGYENENIQLKIFQEKYTRRLIRFEKLLLNNKKLIFVHLYPFSEKNGARSVPKYMDLIKTKKLINKINPKLEYKILFVTCTFLKKHHSIFTSSIHEQDKHALEILKMCKFNNNNHDIHELKKNCKKITTGKKIFKFLSLEPINAVSAAKLFNISLLKCKERKRTVQKEFKAKYKVNIIVYFNWRKLFENFVM